MSLDASNVPLPPSRDSLESVRPTTNLIINSNGGRSNLNSTLNPHEEEEEEEEEEPPISKQDTTTTTISGGEEHVRETRTLYERQRIRELEDELGRTRSEKEAFEAQYRSLLGKLTTMRNTLGDKLKQDADELDRREQEINDLRATKEDLVNTIETLKTELIQSNEDSERVHVELEHFRNRADDDQRSTSELAITREMALRDAQEDLERIRLERDEWEQETMRERVHREDLMVRLGQMEMDLGTAKLEREIMREDRDREAESAANLHAVLEEFQAAKDRELSMTLGDLQTQLKQSNEALGDYKQRAAEAEARVTAVQNDSEKLLALTKDVKDKNLAIGKLRHDAVILNEHLTEALRRLKKDSNEYSVDRRLVSNVLITFLNTPRADTKRFEMLQLISSILFWTDDQREQVGLQRSSGLSGPGIIASGSRPGKGHSRSGKGKAVDEGMGDNENFGQLWVEFLLKEASAASASATAPSTSTSTSTPGSPSLNPTHSSSGSRFDFSLLPPILSPPVVSPTSSETSTRRPSFSSFRSTGSSTLPSTGPPTAPPSIKEER